MYNLVKNEMTEYYRKVDLLSPILFREDIELRDKDMSKKMTDLFNMIYDGMDTFYNANPETPSVLLKSRIHTLMAEHCEPVIFLENPFFFELGYGHSRSRGLIRNTPSCWLTETKNAKMLKNHPEYAEATDKYKTFIDGKTNNLCFIGFNLCFDLDHLTLGYTKLFEVGVRGLMEQAKEQIKSFEKGSQEYDFCSAVIESLDATILIAHKFADKAEELLKACKNERQRANLEMIAETARKIPEYPPKTFYEGLAMLVFMREVVAVLDNNAISQLGHVDRLLGDLYKEDLKAGRITEEEARRLISIWMMFSDIRFDVENNEWPETSACVELGGCDAEGNIVFNDVTKMFVEEQLRLNLINPKLNCRYSSNSPDEYLKLLGKAQLAGHNAFVYFNDDAIIEHLMKSGVEKKDARLYVSGGCQETMIEGCGHTEGTALYFSLLRVFDAFLREDKNTEAVPVLDKAETFEEFYEKFISAFDKFFNYMIDMRHYRLSFYKNAISFPLYSATQQGCIESGTDYVNGGAKYNLSTITIAGFANVADSLYSVKTLVFDQKRLTLDEFRNILENNWQGEELFRQEVINLPKYGHADADVDSLANRLLKDVSGIIGSRENDRGGRYITSLFTYSFNRKFAPLLRATPDGRMDYEYIAQSCGPSTIKAIKDVTMPIKSLHNVDLSVCGGAVAVLDLMLPASSNFDEDRFTAFLKACSKYNCVAMQTNVLSRDVLLDAQKNPQNYKGLIVRISGLSAYFVALTPEVQNEIINRNFYKCN